MVLPERYPTKTRNVCFHSNLRVNSIQNVQPTLPTHIVFGVALNLMSVLIVDGECAMKYVKSNKKIVVSEIYTKPHSITTFTFNTNNVTWRALGPLSFRNETLFF